MTDGPASQVQKILGVLADVSPSAQQRATGLTVPLDWFRWLPARGVALFRPTPVALRRSLVIDQQGADVTPRVRLDRGAGERLAAVDQVRPGARHSLRAGWLFVAGRRPVDGRMQRVLHPLLSVPVRIVLPPLLGQAQVWAAGDVTLSELVRSERRHELEDGYEVGGGALDDVSTVQIPPALLRRLDRLQRFASETAEAAGFQVTGLVPATAGPDELLRADTLAVVAGVAVFAAREVGGLSAAEGLRTWAAGELVASTAFHALYLDATDAEEPEADPDVVTPFPLTSRQREAVATSRAAPVSVLSGAAGTGKSHAVSAIACDAVGRGKTVLVAAKTEAAVDALLVLLREAPGLEPVVFGSSERREELARRLEAGELRPAERDELAAAADALEATVRARDGLAASIAERLRAEAHAQGDPGRLDPARLVAPGLFDPACDLTEVRRLLEVGAGSGGWLAHRRARKAWQQAARLAGAGRGAALAELVAAVDVAAEARVAGDLMAAGGLDLAPLWGRLEEVEAELCRAGAAWLALSCRSPKRLQRSSLQAVAVLGTALRSGRAARRAQLARLDRRLTRALPLWVGTLGDIEDLLPPVPALFDLVILDEASAIDQPLAAPALLRARRTVVVGDPHQLRHVSFLADDQLQEAVEDHGLEADPLLAGRLDVRRNSIFDVAVGVAPATVLDEHFRSAPHLVDFVGRRLYGGRLHVATRSPRTEDSDRVEVVRTPGRRNRTGVVQTEVDEVLVRLGDLLAAGARSVGVVSPFRAQADALEAAVLDAFSIGDLEALDLRVGTVHAFQGNERDVVLVSLGIGEEGTATSWRFAEDPHLFAVMATRARQHLVLLLSAEPPPSGLLAEYLAQADDPPGRPRPAGVPGPWVAEVSESLSAAGLPTVPLYPSGRHAVDVCAGDAGGFVGLECTVHPDGPAAHVERHLALRRAGWELEGAYRSRWGERRGELVVRVAERLRSWS